MSQSASAGPKAQIPADKPSSGVLVAGADRLGDIATLNTAALETPLAGATDVDGFFAASQLPGSAQLGRGLKEGAVEPAPAEDENKPGYIGERNRRVD